MTPTELNDWRVVPRLALLIFTVFAIVVGVWFMLLVDPKASQSAFVSVVWGSAPAWFGL